jgi:O-antigen/teichoic acid export membrane protein
MSIKVKAVRGIVWSAIQSWGTQAASLLVFFLLARLLSPEAFGLVALASVFLAFMQVFLNQGFTQVLIQREALEPEHIDTAFWTNLTIGIVLTLISLATADVVADWFQQAQLAPMLRGFSVLFVITALGNVQQALLERKLAFRAIAVRWLLGTVVGGCVGVGMALNGFGVWSLVSQQLVQELVGTLVLWKSSPWRPGFKVSVKHFHHLFSFGISLVGFNLLNFLNTRADDFLIGYFLGPVALGYYSIAYRILGVMTQLLITTGNQVALPTFSRLQENPEKFRNAFYTATELTALISFPIFLGVAALAPELVLLLFGEQWLPSIPVLQVLSFAGIFRSINFFKSSVFVALGKPHWSLWFGLLNAGLNVIGFTIAVRWGIVAVASAYVIRGYCVFPINQWAIGKLIQIPILNYLKRFVAPVSGSAIAVIIILLIKQGFSSTLNSQLLLMVCVFSGCFVYGFIIRLLSPNLFQKLLELARLVRMRSSDQNA